MSETPPESAAVASPTDRSEGRARIERGLAVLVSAGAFTLPLTFTVAINDVFALPKTLVMLGLSALLVVGLIGLGSHASSTPGGRWSLPVEALAVYVVLTAIATVRSPDPYHSLIGEQLQYQGLLATIGYALAFLAARRTFGDLLRVRRLFLVIVAGAVLVAGYGLLQQAGLDPIWHVLDRGRIFSTLGQANALAAYLVVALPISLALAGTMRNVERAMLSLAAVAIGAALALTLSRGGYIGVGTALLVFVACLRVRSRLTGRRIALGAGIASAVLLSIVVLPPLARPVERVVDRALLTADLSQASTANHLDLWAVGVRMALDHPFLGVGPEIYPALFDSYRNSVLPPARAAVMARFRPESPHDVPLAIADGAGFPALAAYIVVVLLAMRAGRLRLRHATRDEQWLFAGLMAVVAGHTVTDLFMTAEVAGSWIYWVLLGVLFASGDRGMPDRAEPNDES